MLQEVSKTLTLNNKNTTIGVVGLFNKGKTFVVNRLTGTSLPSDCKVNTRGLSMIIPRTGFGKEYVWLDTAGTNSPVTCLSPHLRLFDSSYRFFQ